MNLQEKSQIKAEYPNLDEAAPYLLTALEDFIKQYGGDVDRELRPEMLRARFAIARAKGYKG